MSGYYKEGPGIRFHCLCGEAFDSAAGLDQHIAAKRAAGKTYLSYLDYHRWRGCDYQTVPGLPYYVGYGQSHSQPRIVALMEPWGWELGSYVVLPQR